MTRKAKKAQRRVLLGDSKDKLPGRPGVQMSTKASEHINLVKKSLLSRGVGRQ